MENGRRRWDGLEGGTPRTIEGPLYIAGAPLSKGEARLDDGSEQGEVLFMSGQVRGTDGKPIAGAIVDVWHANTQGRLLLLRSVAAQVQPAPAHRDRRRRPLPLPLHPALGLLLPAGRSTQKLLDLLGRHGNRPAHIHFFVSAPGFRQLTTQINIDGDEYLHDDFALATRDGLIPAGAAGQRSRGDP